ncbi:Beta-lactamase [Escherichia coli ISC7]|uniref:Beta-lactamase n=1 Tax=Escherichia coli ISC7 TaxID=1432555 RepID=W1F8I4_ECOLX|nr:Beta-lactamase [Escherichia coli ISC7]
MMKKSLCCALLLTASFSTFAAAKTEQQIADIVNRTITPVDAGAGYSGYGRCRYLPGKTLLFHLG